MRSGANIVDALIVSINVFELIINQSMVDEQTLRVMVALKAILAYRFIKYYSFAIKMMNLALASLPSYLNLTFLMFILVFLFACIG